MKHLNNIFFIGFLAFILLGIASCSSSKQTVDWTNTSYQDAQKQAIADVMAMQEAAWNEANIDQFMEGYWKSEKLRFSGSSVTYGWENTKNNYKKGYPNKEAMGKLMFEIKDIELTSAESAILFGRYTLIRTLDQPTGLFNLAWRKIDGNWLITSDMTCG